MRRLLAALALTLVIGCGDDDDPTAPGNAAFGTYPLVTVNGQPLPETIYEEPDYKLELTAGSVTLNSNGTFTDSYTLRETIAGQVQAPDEVPCGGSWTRSGNTFTLTETETDECGDVGTAAWDGSNTLTLNWGVFDVPLVHRR